MNILLQIVLTNTVYKTIFANQISIPVRNKLFFIH